MVYLGSLSLSPVTRPFWTSNFFTFCSLGNLFDAFKIMGQIPHCCVTSFRLNSGLHSQKYIRNIPEGSRTRRVCTPAGAERDSVYSYRRLSTRWQQPINIRTKASIQSTMILSADTGAGFGAEY